MLWAVISLALLIVGLTLEIVLALVAAGLAALTGLATALIPDDDPGTSRPGVAAKPAQPQGSGGYGSKPHRPVPGGSGVPRCTETRQPIDQCGCARRHVATADGAKRYGLPVGAPLGKKKGGS